MGVVITEFSIPLFVHLRWFKKQTYVLQDGRSPLYTSVLDGDLDVVKTLIEAGANIDQADKVSTHIPTHGTCMTS